MALSDDQISNLLGMVCSSQSDNLDCDGCFDHLAEFAEAKLQSREIPDALKEVENHLQQCACCKDEFNALLEGLRAMQQGEEK